MTGALIARRVVVSGRVQGVGFREATRREALAAGVAGWVRNRADGTVEALLEGSPGAVETLLGFVHAGPPGARVRGVDARPAPVTGATGFAVARDA